MTRRRPHILVLNQYYWPGVEATANLLADLCRALAEDYDVTVVTGRLAGQKLPFDEVVAGVRILRTRSTAYDRTKLPRRATNYLTYLADSIMLALARHRADLVVCMTDPPIVGDIGVLVARRYGAPLLVISEDVFPEIAVELGRLTNPLAVGALRRLVTFYLRRADAIVAIGNRMRERLIAKGALPERILVIPNWVDTRAITAQPHVNRWARQHELENSFVVMHSGNVGHAQNLDMLVLAATYIRDIEDLAIVIVGSGARSVEIGDLADRLEADNVRFLDYQPREVLSESLSAARLHYVGLVHGLSGYVVPSRVYGVLSAARPVLAAADDDSETAQLVRSVGCGIVVPPDRPDRVAAAIRDAYEGKFDLDEMGRRGREYVEREADRTVALERYRTLVRGMLDGRAMPFSSSSER